MTEPVRAKPITAMTVAGVGLAVGLALVLAGLTLGIVETSAGCGSAFSAKALAGDYCTAATSARKGIALTLILPGVLLTIWSGIYAGTLGALKERPVGSDTPKPTS